MQAQAQVQKQHTISHNESLELVRCLLRVSIFHISYLRGLFPDEWFKGVNMKNLDGMHIKMLTPACEESRRLIDWVEGGVHDAIKRGYLKTLFFGIASDPGGSELLEEYIFNFNYGGEDGVSLDIAQKHKGSGSKKLHSSGGQKAETSVEAVKYQVTRLMRMLVQICQTLDRVPQERFLFMKLMYHEQVPEDYEPPYFVPVERDGAIGHFSRKPFSMAVGNVNTCHHGVVMRIKSTLDCCEDGGEGDAGEPEMVASAGAASTQLDEAGSDMEEVQVARVQPIPEGPEGMDLEEGGAGGKQVDDVDYQAIKDYTTRTFGMFSQLEVVDALGALPMHPDVIEAAFDRMEREGVVVKDANRFDSYRPGPSMLQAEEQQQPHATQPDGKKPRKQGRSDEKAAAVAAAAAEAQQLMGKLVVGEQGDDVRAHQDQMAMMDPTSQRGGVQTTGSDITGSGSPRQHAPPVAGAPADENVHFDSGRQSGSKAAGGSKPAKGPRKASYVAEPIHQTRAKNIKKPKRQAAAAAAAGPTAATPGRAGRVRK